MKPTLTCDGCKWYLDWFGLCRCADADDCGMTPKERCELYETSEEMKEK